jgi:hypothetical protein
MLLLREINKSNAGHSFEVLSLYADKVGNFFFRHHFIIFFGQKKNRLRHCTEINNTFPLHSVPDGTVICV